MNGVYPQTDLQRKSAAVTIVAGDPVLITEPGA